MNTFTCIKCNIEKDWKYIAANGTTGKVCLPCKAKMRKDYRHSVYGLIKKMYYTHTHTQNRNVIAANYSFEDLYSFVVFTLILINYI